MNDFIQILGLFILGTVCNVLLAFAAKAINHNMYRDGDLLVAWALARKDLHIAYGLGSLLGSCLTALTAILSGWSLVRVMAAIIAFNVLWQVFVVVVQHFDLRAWMRPSQLR